MKLFIIAGEASGDLHGASLIKSLKIKRPDLQISAWGGDLMAAAGAEITKHYKELAFMGFVEVLKNIKTIRKNFKTCKKTIEAYQPDAVILIDYPGFNLRMAKWLHNNNIKVIYYIAPQLWAWHSSRVKQIKRYVDRMITILPFEPGFYESHQVDVDYVGHPLVSQIKDFKPRPNFNNTNGLTEQALIVLLPGSRQQEVSKMLPIMQAASQRKELAGYQFVVAGVSTIDKALYEESGLKVIYDSNYDLLANASFAWVSSGTATLETALWGVPQLVCYTGNPYSYILARRLIKVPFISLVNLIGEQEIVEELIQDAFNADSLVLGTYRLELHQERIKRLYLEEVANKLGTERASDQAAEIILKSI